jgi:hypothetical protein
VFDEIIAQKPVYFGGRVVGTGYAPDSSLRRVKRGGRAGMLPLSYEKQIKSFSTYAAEEGESKKIVFG